jgi:hypothetical protein
MTKTADNSPPGSFESFLLRDPNFGFPMTASTPLSMRPSFD